jgi:enoyl-CoA hydratase
VLRLDHGPVSAMDVELCRALAVELRAVADGPAGAVVLTGTGGSFSAGVDLKRLLAGGAEYIDVFLPALADLFLAVFELAKPVVAAVNGHAIAGGCVLAAAADTVVMAEGKGRVGVPELKVGVPFPNLAMEIVRYKVGDIAARRLVFGAATHTPAEAIHLGLVDEVVAPEGLLRRALELASHMAGDIPADTFAATKRYLREEALKRVRRGTESDLVASELWKRRIDDGWTARYMESLSR